MATHLRALQEPDPLPPAQRLTPTEVVPIHIPAIQETNLARPSFRSSVLAAVRVSEPSPKTWPRRGNGWNSNERDDPVVSWINDCDCVICRVDCVEQTG